MSLITNLKRPLVETNLRIADIVNCWPRSGAISMFAALFTPVNKKNVNFEWIFLSPFTIKWTSKVNSNVSKAMFTWKLKFWQSWRFWRHHYFALYTFTYKKCFKIFFMVCLSLINTKFDLSKFSVVWQTTSCDFKTKNFV